MINDVGSLVTLIKIRDELSLPSWVLGVTILVT